MPDCCTPLNSGTKKGKVAESGSAPNLAAMVEPNLCPICSCKGKKVESITLKAMLNINLVTVRDASYFFCRTTACEVVYFSGDGEQFFTKTQVREPVFQKELHNEDVFVCYCFRHSPATIQAEWLSTGHSTVIDKINAGIQAGQCACEIRNPQGSCCLGNVSQVVEQIKRKAKIQS